MFDQELPDSTGLERICSKVGRTFKRGKLSIQNRYHENGMLLSRHLYRHTIPDSSRSREQSVESLTPILYEPCSDSEVDTFIFCNLHVPRGKFPDLRQISTEQHLADGGIQESTHGVSLEVEENADDVEDGGGTYQGIIPLMLSMFA